MRSRKLVERYIIAAIIPYFILALVLLSVMLIGHQVARFGEILGTARAPFGLAFEIMRGLIPNVLVFTVPLAVLAAVVTGFSRMATDSELVALRAAGIGIWRLTLPVIIVAGGISIVLLYIALFAGPRAARGVRRAALRAALLRLESPVEPRAFHTEIPGKIIYVQNGNQDRGQWEGIFIHAEEQSGEERLVTARSGRVDTSGEQAELVLSDAVVTTRPKAIKQKSSESINADTDSKEEVVTETLAQWRVKLNTGRNELLKRFEEQPLEPDEMDWPALRRAHRSVKDVGERRLLGTIIHRRLALGCAPLVFALLGVGLGLGIQRGGRGAGIVVAILAMLTYYLIALAGEQMARTGGLPPAVGGWLATGAATLAAIWLLAGKQGLPRWAMWKRQRAAVISSEERSRLGKADRPPKAKRPIFSGLLDKSILRSLAMAFTLSLTALIAIFMIFTLFELWRFIVLRDVGVSIVLGYVLYLLPFVTVILAPMSLLVAQLVIYALIARRSEAIAWWGCGQSAYRLALPGLLFAGLVGGGLWVIGEKIMPGANRRQDALRQQIKGGDVARAVTGIGRQWLATTTPAGKRIYDYEFGERGVLQRPVIYEFGETHLKRIVSGSRAYWKEGEEEEYSTLIVEEATETLLFSAATRPSPEAGNKVRQTLIIRGAGSNEAFKPMLNRPSQMSDRELSSYIKLLKWRGEPHTAIPYLVARERKRATPLYPVVMTLIAIPLALAFGRRSAVTALSAAVFIGAGFWAAVTGFEQLAIFELMPASIAAWAPPILFAATGTHLLSRTRT